MIEVKNLFLKYIREHYALYDISLSVAKGEVVAIVGTEHSGKTTLLRVLAKLEKYNKGEVYIKDIPLKKLSLKSDVSMAYLPEKPVFLKNKTVYENFKDILVIRKTPEKDIETTINNALIEYNLEKLKDTKVEDLTLFEKYLISLVRFTFREVEIALIDNIFETLTDEEIAIVVKMIKDIFISKKSTVIIATTKESIAKDFKARVINFEYGSIIKAEKNAKDSKSKK